MVIRGGIKPEVELLLSVALPLGIHISVKDVRISAEVPEELEVDLVVSRTYRRELHARNILINFDINFYG